MCLNLLECSAPWVLSSTEFINTSHPLTHHRSKLTATGLQNLNTTLEDFFRFRFLTCIIFPVSNSARELSNLNGNPKHKIGRKDIGLEFYVPISIFTAAKRAIWGYMNICVYNLCRITMPRCSMRIWSEFCLSYLSWFSDQCPGMSLKLFTKHYEIPKVFSFILLLLKAQTTLT